MKYFFHLILYEIINFKESVNCFVSGNCTFLSLSESCLFPTNTIRHFVPCFPFNTLSRFPFNISKLSASLIANTNKNPSQRLIQKILS